MAAPFSRQRPQRPAKENELHEAALVGSTELTFAILTRGGVNIDERAAPKGLTALMIAASLGQCHVVRVLLKKGAGIAVTTENGCNCSALFGSSRTPGRDNAAGEGRRRPRSSGLYCRTDSDSLGRGIRAHPEVVRSLIEVGANPNSRQLDGAIIAVLRRIEGTCGYGQGAPSRQSEPAIDLFNSEGRGACGPSGRGGV